VTQRRLLLPEAWAAPTPAPLELSGPRGHYLARVLRLLPGQELLLFDGQGRERPATIREVARDGLRLALGPSGPAARPDGPTELALLAGLTRGAALDRVVRETSELGVSELRPVVCARSVAVPQAARRDERQARWQRIAGESARQCGRATVPLVHAVTTLAEALRRLDTDAADRWPVRLVGSPTATRPLALSPASGPGVLLLVGPEGGLQDAELTLAEEHGFVPFRLGRRVLRAETAMVVGVALVQHQLGELG